MSHYHLVVLTNEVNPEVIQEAVLKHYFGGSLHPSFQIVKGKVKLGNIGMAFLALPALDLLVLTGWLAVLLLLLLHHVAVPVSELGPKLRLSLVEARNTPVNWHCLWDELVTAQNGEEGLILNLLANGVVILELTRKAVDG